MPGSMKLVFGINSRYGENISEYPISESDVIHRINTCATMVERETGIYISSVLKPCKVCYKPEWGCPNDGEAAYELSCVQNPLFSSDQSKWESSAIKFAEEIKKEFKQSSLTIELTSAIVIYLN